MTAPAIKPPISAAFLPSCACAGAAPAISVAHTADTARPVGMAFLSDDMVVSRRIEEPPFYAIRFEIRLNVALPAIHQVARASVPRNGRRALERCKRKRTMGRWG